MKFRGTTDEGETIEFKIYCKDSDNVIEYGSEIGVHQGIWHYVKKDTLECLELQDLERQLEEAREENEYLKKKNKILIKTVEYNVLKVSDLKEQLKEKGE